MMWETLLAVSMFFAGGIGSMAILYLKRISVTLDRQIEFVADIDRRVVRVETKMIVLNK